MTHEELQEGKFLIGVHQIRLFLAAVFKDSNLNSLPSKPAVGGGEKPHVSETCSGISSNSPLVFGPRDAAYMAEWRKTARHV